MFVKQPLALPGLLNITKLGECYMRLCLNELQKEYLLREDKTHSTGLTMSDPQIMVPNEP